MGIKPTRQRKTTQESTPTMMTFAGGAITYEMYRTSDTYKNIFKDADENLKKIQDKVDCLQRSQVYVHDHISKVENDLNQLKNLILLRLTHVEFYDAQMAEVN
jgi:hypothetical protein